MLNYILWGLFFFMLAMKLFCPAAIGLSWWAVFSPLIAMLVFLIFFSLLIVFMIRYVRFGG